MVNSLKAHEFAPDPLKSALKEEGAEYFTVEMLSGVVPTLPDLDAMAGPGFLLFFEPPSIDARIANQYALFSVMPGPVLDISAWLADHADLCHKVIVPAGLKWEIRDRLDMANITERVLFPGLDGLSRWQRRYYTPRQD